MLRLFFSHLLSWCKMYNWGGGGGGASLLFDILCAWISQIIAGAMAILKQNELHLPWQENKSPHRYVASREVTSPVREFERIPKSRASPASHFSQIRLECNLLSSSQIAFERQNKLQVANTSH